MRKIASPRDLQAELGRLQREIQTKPVSRKALGAQLRDLASRVYPGTKVAVKLPSEEEDGKPSYDKDFKAGFEAGKKAYKADDSISSADGEKAYRKVSKTFGIWWKDGYSAAIDMARGAYATKPAQIAKKLGLS